MLNWHQHNANLSKKAPKKLVFSTTALVQVRYHKCAGTLMHKYLVGINNTDFFLDRVEIDHLGAFIRDLLLCTHNVHSKNNSISKPSQ